MDPRIWYGLAVVALGLLVWHADGEPPNTTPEMAHIFAGHVVTMDGFVKDSQRTSTNAKFVLVNDGYAVTAYTSQTPVDGSYIAATGTVIEQRGVPVLHVTKWHLLAPPTAHEADLLAIAKAPENWVHKPLLLAGEVSNGTLRQGGHEIRVIGNIEAGQNRGQIAYVPECVCHAFVVEPWS